VEVIEDSQLGLFRKKIDKYERLEKAKFYLQQEEVELDRMVYKINKGKDEIDNHLRNEKNILEKIMPSGTKNVLLAILRNMKLPEKQFKGIYF